MIFPEGMRVRHGELGRFLQGGARLACANGVQVVPVAVDSGYCWPTHDWRKRPGLITVRIGPPLRRHNAARPRSVGWCGTGSRGSWLMSALRDPAGGMNDL